jgi:hypothetical protein
MSRPDYGRIQHQARQIGNNVGYTATIRRYLSGSGGVPQYGVSELPQYNERLVTGMFVPVTFEEISRAGGQYIAGDMKATILDYHPQPNDEVRYSGTIYRVESDPMPQPMLGQMGYRCLLRRGDK